MDKKYAFTGETKVWIGRTLYRIRACISFGTVKAGDLGGWIEKEENLSHKGQAWVSGQAVVSDQAHWLITGPMGSRNAFTTFFRAKGHKIMVRCGCFFGDIEAFEENVKLTHGDSKHAKAYMAAIALAKTQIDLSGDDPEIEGTSHE